MKENKSHASKVVYQSTKLRGFILPFTMLITVLVLFISTGALALLSKQQYFSKLYKETQAAYYAADDAVACTTLIDDSYVASDGLGIFPSTPADQNGAIAYIDSVLAYMNDPIRRDIAEATLTKENITCGQSQIFAPGGDPVFNPNFTVSPTSYSYNFTNPQTNGPDTEQGVSLSYNMKMDLGLDPLDVKNVRHLYRCAKVTVNKTPSFRQIIAQGYSNCNGTGNSVERAVVNTTIIE
jgi:hypothetical protein